MSREKKAKKIISGVYDLSLGISIVCCNFARSWCGLFCLQNTAGLPGFFGWGVSWGIGAALLNVQKAL
ncbi:hypothetical protein [Helicobacter mustelae]|uniref:hypothetical protein n=1 Tax=Helicobacter mustelae TaxID=217 RepID=UPI000E0F23E8